MLMDAVRLAAVHVDQRRTVWLEGRPQDGGRGVLVASLDDAEPVDLTPAPFSVRSRVHEYGGGAFVIDGDDLWFCNDADQRIHHQRLAPLGVPRPLTASGTRRYADMVVDRARGRLIAVCENHDYVDEPENSLVSIDLDSGEVQRLVSGSDFYASPVLSPDGRRLVWLSWEHPNMPWDCSELWTATLDGQGALLSLSRVAGGADVSVFQPSFAPDGSLFYVCDRSGFWNLYHCRPDDGQANDQADDQTDVSVPARDGSSEVGEGTVVDPEGPALRMRAEDTGSGHPCVHRERAEYGMPQWVFGMRTYGFVDDDQLVVGSCRDGCWSLQRLQLASGEWSSAPFELSALSALACTRGRAVVVSSSATTPAAVTCWDTHSNDCRVLKTAVALRIDPEYVAAPEPLTFATSGDDIAHGFLYRPRNKRFEPEANERPPLIVISHGGPTGASTPSLNLAVQFWTSRGFAVLDVNYRGSTGYGRAYREPLRGQWGVVDVDDCVNGARHLARAGVVDEQRLAIRGSSAGGFTTLAALTFHDVFKAGASYYGISELEALARDTHKFESRYLDSLIGAYPEQLDLYRRRSPIHHIERLSCPVIFFQGAEDKVVPPDQALMMAKAVKEKGLPTACLIFEGEQHGFRRAATIRRTLEAELFFYGRIFGFRPADPIAPVEIENL
ncbi:MAG: S9 family peptidase [Gammaproteobacteria bacterium]|nr:S9 family peptidase [Gammaproteobacteria bacterium]